MINAPPSVRSVGDGPFWQCAIAAWLRPVAFSSPSIRYRGQRTATGDTCIRSSPPPPIRAAVESVQWEANSNVYNFVVRSTKTIWRRVLKILKILPRNY